MPLANDHQIQLRVSAGILRKIDQWRKKQPDIISRSEAIRRLIDLGLTTGPSKGPEAKSNPK
jgi:hypothetical protein